MPAEIEPANRFREGAPAWWIEDTRRYCQIATFVVAKTDKSAHPHQYALQERAARAGLGPEHVSAANFIRAWGLRRHWHGHMYRSVNLDGFSYWVMDWGSIINRQPVEFAG